jgi:hypothetical protein
MEGNFLQVIIRQELTESRFSGRNWSLSLIYNQRIATGHGHLFPVIASEAHFRRRRHRIPTFSQMSDEILASRLCNIIRFTVWGNIDHEQLCDE